MSCESPCPFSALFVILHAANAIRAAGIHIFFHLILFFWLSTIQLQLKRRYIIGIYGLDISPPDLPGGVQALNKLRDICLAL